MEQLIKSKVDAFLKKAGEEMPKFTERKKFFIRKNDDDAFVRIIPEPDGTVLRLFGLHYINDGEGNLMGSFYCPTLTSLEAGQRNPDPCPICDYITQHKDNETVMKWMAQKRPVVKVIDVQRREAGVLYWDMNFQNATRLAALISEYPYVSDPEKGVIIYVKVDRSSQYPEYHFSIFLDSEGNPKKAPIDLDKLPEVTFADAFGAPTQDFIEKLADDASFDFGYNASGKTEAEKKESLKTSQTAKNEEIPKKKPQSLDDFMKNIGIAPK